MRNSRRRQYVAARHRGRARVEGAHGALRVVEDGALAAQDGRIAWVGPRAALPAELADGADLIDAGGRLVIPGFVDAHTHPIFAGLRAEEFCARALGQSYAELLARGDAGIMSTVLATRAASEDDLLRLARERAQAFLRHGTTTIEAKTGYGLSPDGEEKSLRVLERLREATPLRVVGTYLGAHLVPAEYRDDPERYMRLLLDEMLPQAAGRVAFCDVFCDQGAFTVEQSRRILTPRPRAGHGRRGCTPTNWPTSGRRGWAPSWAPPRPTTWSTSTTWAWRRWRGPGPWPRCFPAPRSAWPPTTTPRRGAWSSTASRWRWPPTAIPAPATPRTWPWSSPWPLLKLKLTAEEALRAATLGGAYSLRLQDQVGSLEVGKRCDLAILDARTYQEIPYHFGVNLCRAVVLDGTLVVDRRDAP